MEEILMNADQKKKVNEEGPVKKKRSNINQIKMNKTKVINGTKRKKQKFQNKPNPAIYIGHLPHGFYEDEMSAYFNQFGKVCSVVVARSKKTGRSKGYGYVEFKNEEVAKIAAESMNNYLMFNRVLRCKYIPAEERRGRVSFKPMYPILPKVKNKVIDSRNKRKAFIALNKDTYQKKTQKKINNFKKFFEEKGIDFSFKDLDSGF